MLTRTLHKRSGSVGGATHKRIPPISFLAPYGFTRPLTRTHVRLLGPCFKTGRMGSPQADARSAQVPKHAESARAAVHNRDDDVSASISTPRLGPPSQSASVNVSSRLADRHKPFHIRPRHIAGPHPLPSRQFQALFDSLSKSFSSFPRGTCSLSVSRQYLALDGIYRPIGAAFQTTRLADSASWCDRVRAQRGSHPLRRPLPGDLGPVRR
ncbi:hypothetical protein KIW84_UN0175 [Lathyrus oleraceus]|nr:hypothetical protein KIW84_UN0175 [Pisum sativum]